VAETVYVPVELPSGNKLTLPVHGTTGVYDVAGMMPKIAANAMEGVREFGDLLKGAALACAPDSLDIELSIGFEVTSGQLTTFLVEGGANGSVTLTLHWDTSREGRDGA
jgi:hypothetical protein